MSSDESRPIRCPFCGAPYKKLIPPDVLQLNCEYCGATFNPPSEDTEIPRCQNHMERRATGKCNDCGGEFCSECLQTYEFNTRDGSAELYLCPECLHEREANKSNSLILGGFAFLLVGIVSSFVAFPIGILGIIGGVIAIVYGFSKKPEGEPATREPQAETETPSEGDWEKADKLYGTLLEKYSQNWGVSTAASLLEDEIRAYTWDGYSWPEAVRKVYQRKEKKN